MAEFSYFTQRVIDLIIPTTFGKPSYDMGRRHPLPTPDNDVYMFLRENLQMSYDRVPAHAFTFMSSYDLGELALRMLDGLLALVWKSPNLSIKIVMIYLVYLKHVVEYNIIDLMIPSTSTSFSVSISMSIIIPPVHYAISIWKTQYKPFKLINFFYFLMSSKSRLIAVSEKTYHELAAMGTLEDSFNSVIEKMIEERQKAASGQTLAGTGQTTAAPLQTNPTQSRRSKRVT